MSIINIKELESLLYSWQDKRIVGIQGVSDSGKPLGEEVFLTGKEVEEGAIIGRVKEDDGIEQLPKSQMAITSDWKRRFYYVDRMVVRSSHKVQEIPGVVGRYNVAFGTDATHREYVVVEEIGRRHLIIRYRTPGLLPVTVKSGDKERLLGENEVIALNRGEETMIRLSGMYGVVGRANDDALIVDRAWLRIRHLP